MIQEEQMYTIQNGMLLLNLNTDSKSHLSGHYTTRKPT